MTEGQGDRWTRPAEIHGSAGERWIMAGSLKDLYLSNPAEEGGLQLMTIVHRLIYLVWSYNQLKSNHCLKLKKELIDHNLSYSQQVFVILARDRCWQGYCPSMWFERKKLAMSRSSHCT